MEIKEDNFIAVPAHARLIYDLKGNDLLLYGLIYGFSQDGESWCTCGQQYMCDWLGVSDTKTVRTILDRLISIGAITKEEVFVNNVKFCKYKSNIPYRSRKYPTPGVESTGNNINNELPLDIDKSIPSPKG